MFHEMDTIKYYMHCILNYPFYINISVKNAAKEACHCMRQKANISNTCIYTHRYHVIVRGEESSSLLLLL